MASATRRRLGDNHGTNNCEKAIPELGQDRKDCSFKVVVKGYRCLTKAEAWSWRTRLLSRRAVRFVRRTVVEVCTYRLSGLRGKKPDNPPVSKISDRCGNLTGPPRRQ